MVKAIKATNSKAKIIYYKLDLGDLSSIKEFAGRVSDSCEQADMLINNAGLSTMTRRETKDGFEMTMGVNHFGHAYLTHLLMPKLKKAACFRVINVSSKAHMGIKSTADFDMDDIDYKLTPFATFKAYSKSKSANILFTSELQRRIDAAGTNGIVVSLHPGTVRTEIFDHIKWWQELLLKWVLWPVWWIYFKTSWEGAQTTLHTALEADDKLQKGCYYDECAVGKIRTFSRDLKNAAKLW